MKKTIEQNVQKPSLQRLQQVRRLVGDTPLHPLYRIFQKEHVQLMAKLEWQQIGHSVKTRPAFNMIKNALERGDLEGKRILDASSGNTAVALAAIGSSLGLSLTLVVPENASSQKIANLKALGSELIFSSRFEGTDGAQSLALEMATDYPEKYWYADQYNNEDNWKAHYEMTGPEIYEQTKGAVTHFVAGLGTTGTFTGTTMRLKKFNPSIQAFSLQPDMPMHGLEGWKHMETAKRPGIFQEELADGNLQVGTEEALDLMKRVATEEGLVLSPSSAASLAGAIKLGEQINSGIVVTVFPDAGYNYPEVLKEIFI